MHSTQAVSPWKALIALCFGFFMILVDQTIVAVATSELISELDASYNQTIWVTSAYLLAYAVPLLVTGRMGDQFGPRNMYIAGLTVFTLASVACGMSESIGMLIAARVVQGLGAALIAPQSMSVITRVFPLDKRGAAFGFWGAVAGIATIVGPIAGGLIVGSLGWEWIFFINIPLGLLGIVLALAWVPALERTSRRYDPLGIILALTGMFCVIYALQQGYEFQWSPWVFGVLAAGVALLVGMTMWQRVVAEPLIPLRIFSDRNFSLGNYAIATMTFCVAGTMVPLMLFVQAVNGYDALQSGLLLVPLAIVSGVSAPLVGRAIDKGEPRSYAIAGFLMLAISMMWLAYVLKPGVSMWDVLPALIIYGGANGCVWSSTAAATLRNLDVSIAGAGSGVYNTTRQVGAVVGSAAIAAVMNTVAARVDGGIGDGEFSAVALSQGVSMAMYAAAIVACTGVIAAYFFLPKTAADH